MEKQPKEEKRASLQGAVEQQDGGFAFVPTASRQQLPLLKFNTSSASIGEAYWHTGSVCHQLLKGVSTLCHRNSWPDPVSVLAESKQVKELRGTRLLMKNIPQPLPKVNTTSEIIQ